MRNKPSRRVSNMLDFPAWPHGKLLPKKTGKNRGRGRFPIPYKLLMSLRVKHASSCGGFRFFLFTSPIHSQFCPPPSSSLRLHCAAFMFISQVWCPPRVQKRNAGVFSPCKQTRMCSFISLHHLEVLKIQEKTFLNRCSSHESNTVLEFEINEMKSAHKDPHTYGSNFSGCEAHPTSSLSLPFLVALVGFWPAIPFVHLLSSQSGLSVFYLFLSHATIQSQYRKTLHLHPALFRSFFSLQQTAGFCSWWTATSPLFASCPLMPRTRRFQRTENSIWIAVIIAPTGWEKERKRNRPEGKKKRWEVETDKIYIHSL